MTNWQFYLVMGVPSLAVLIGLVVNRRWWNATDARFTESNARHDAGFAETGFAETNVRIDRLETLLLQILHDMREYRDHRRA